MIGVSRAITDWAWSCYLADLAVHPDYQRKGIGRQLVEKTREVVGDESSVLLLSVPEAMEYYPKIGMEKLNNAFVLWRKY
jgi:ribosomal protein S18 acetylase RimI-like enzyme